MDYWGLAVGLENLVNRHLLGQLDLAVIYWRVFPGGPGSLALTFGPCRVWVVLAMQDEASAFLASVKERTATLFTICPGFEVFEITEGKLLAFIPHLGLQSFSGPDYIVMHQLQEELEKQRTDDALWALAYIDLWYCSNFHGAYWRGLVLLDRRNIRFAIQAALYVWWSSGSDSSAALAGLIKDCSCTAEAREYLDGLVEMSEWGRWAKRVLP